ncbi:MAG TPA: beta galactosidase jelly roll domain-containing protein, partial [Opitutaceae bacterium]|nr:beta galactosidase jelly roll domain-containing protein [Opitutaceae bacterium]
MSRLVRKVLTALLLSAASVLAAAPSGPAAGGSASAVPRERLRMDAGWRFALGNATDPARDFGHATGYFSYLAKAGYGDGPAAPGFDDRAWRIVNVPHDWAVELPFDPRGSASHGFKAIGRAFPQNSVGWYRKTFAIPATDLGRRISLEFDGVYRAARVWVNGFYVGEHDSGYTGFRYDVTDYLNYGGDNVVVVRADATMEQGWFYEGAGIYRHVWLVKTAPVHVAHWGTAVTTEMGRNGDAQVTARTSVVNDGNQPVRVEIEQIVVDPDGRIVAHGTVGASPVLTLAPGGKTEYPCVLDVPHARLWSLDSPALHTLVTTIRSDGNMVDRTETPFGIRSIRFDPDHGFFLNGRRVELKGVNLHQDHAGVGVALPDALQTF